MGTERLLGHGRNLVSRCSRWSVCDPLRSIRPKPHARRRWARIPASRRYARAVRPSTVRITSLGVPVAVDSGPRLVALLGVSMMDSAIDELLGELGRARPEYITDRNCYASERERGLGHPVQAGPRAVGLGAVRRGRRRARDVGVSHPRRGFRGVPAVPRRTATRTHLRPHRRADPGPARPAGAPKAGCFARWDFERHYCTVDFTPEGRIKLVTVGLLPGPPIQRRPLTQEQRAAQPDLLRAPSYDAVPEELAEFRDVFLSSFSSLGSRRTCRGRSS